MHCQGIRGMCRGNGSTTGGMYADASPDACGGRRDGRPTPAPGRSDLLARPAGPVRISDRGGAVSCNRESGRRTGGERCAAHPGGEADPRPRCGRGQHARRAWPVRGGRAWPAGAASCWRRSSHCCGTGWHAQRHATHDRDASCGHGMAMPPPQGRPFPAARTTLTAA
jgi:hypothetical protein